MTRKLAWCAALIVISILPPQARAEWVFYEGNRGTQDIVCNLPQAPLFVHFGAYWLFPSNPYGCDNDEARSVKLNNIPAGAMLVVFDNGDCAGTDDYTRIKVKQYIPELIIDSFEDASYSTPQIEYQSTYMNGLDGKVSCAQISLCGDSLCTAGESEYLCQADCPSGGGGGCPEGQCCGTSCASDCGNGTCEYMQGECDSNCPQDCSGVYCQ